MAAVPCDKCGNKMNAEAVVCPHCGARREGAGGLGKVKMSKDELQALVAVAAPGYEAPRGLWKTLLWPHDETRAGVRTAETLLTIACLPMVLAGLGTIGVGRWLSRSKVLLAAPGEYGAAMFMTVVGGIGLLLALGGETYSLPIIAAEAGMLWTRAWLRHTSTRKYKLTAVAKAEPQPALPVAQARISGSQQTVPKLASPAPAPVQPSSGEPALLK